MLYADFESILKPVYERYRDKMNTMRAKGKRQGIICRKDKHIGWCVHSTFACGDVPDSLKMYRGKDCVEKFIEYIEEEVKWLHATFPQQPTTGLN